MKKIILFSCALLLIFSCKKDKLEGEKSILQGKWKWVGATEIQTAKSNGSIAYIVHSANEFEGIYSIEFHQNGKVSFLKNNDKTESYRLVFTFFNSNCNYYENCNDFGIYLNNDKEKQLGGGVSSDSLLIGCDYTNLPLKSYEDSDYSYSYVYEYIKVN